jgi:hypothetical protein
MISVSFDDKMFMREMSNILEYATGFVDGAQKAKPVMLKNLGYKIKEILYAYIDAMARVEPARLHHVYEWYKVGSPEARLYHLDCLVSGVGLTVSYTLSQSKSIRSGSNVPFYNKASIMENGTPVTIKPRNAQALAFEQDGEMVFTKQPVRVENPGGIEVEGAFAETLKTFFNSYLSQAMLDVTGMRRDLEDMSEFKQSFRGAKTGGYSLGVATGIKWISKVGTIE